MNNKLKHFLPFIAMIAFSLQSCDKKSNQSTENAQVKNEMQHAKNSDIDNKIEEKPIIGNNSYHLENEKLAFAFQTKNGKKLTVCTDKDNAYIVYRFGSADKIEIEFPENKDESSFQKFEYTGWERNGGVKNEGINLNYLTFSANGFKYIIYDTYFAVGDKQSVGIRVVNTKTNKQTDIKGIYKSIQGNLGDFRSDDRIPKGEELYD